MYLGRTPKTQLERQVQRLREEHERRCDQAEQDWKQDAQQCQKEQGRLGVVGSTVKMADLSVMSLEERDRFEVAGLDREELMSQGFMEPDDFYNPADAPLGSGGEETRQYYVFSAEKLAVDEEF